MLLPPSCLGLLLLALLGHGARVVAAVLVGLALAQRLDLAGLQLVQILPAQMHAPQLLALQRRRRRRWWGGGVGEEEEKKTKENEE